MTNYKAALKGKDLSVRKLRNFLVVWSKEGDFRGLNFGGSWLVGGDLLAEDCTLRMLNGC